jgi:hypothetical protein
MFIPPSNLMRATKFLAHRRDGCGRVVSRYKLLRFSRQWFAIPRDRSREMIQMLDTRFLPVRYPTLSFWRPLLHDCLSIITDQPLTCSKHRPPLGHKHKQGHSTNPLHPMNVILFMSKVLYPTGIAVPQAERENEGPPLSGWHCRPEF